jgi:hypothetical protein
LNGVEEQANSRKAVKTRETVGYKIIQHNRLCRILTTSFILKCQKNSTLEMMLLRSDATTHVRVLLWQCSGPKRI